MSDPTIASSEQSIRDGIRQTLAEVRQSYAGAPKAAKEVVDRVETIGQIIMTQLVLAAGDASFGSPRQAEAFVSSFKGLLAILNGMLLQTMSEDDQRKTVEVLAKVLLTRMMEGGPQGDDPAEKDPRIPAVTDRSRLN